MIGDNISSVDFQAFRNCSNLTRVTFGRNVTYIGTEAFSDCDSLTDVVLPESITYIGVRSFFDCDNLRRVEIKARSVPDIGAAAFVMRGIVQ
jgi:hypothetical protein